MTRITELQAKARAIIPGYDILGITYGRGYGHFIYIYLCIFMYCL